jgi:hypothetical protein
MDRTEEYLKRAEASEAAASRAPDSKTRRQFSELAAQWRALAGHAAGPARFENKT